VANGSITEDLYRMPGIKFFPAEAKGKPPPIPHNVIPGFLICDFWI